MESPTPSPLTGVTLHGRVLLGRCSGGDGTVSVYDGLDTVADRLVTVTLLDPARAADPADAHAFLSRSQTLAGLDSPHLVRVLGDGRDGDRVYLVTEPAPGETLRAVLGGGDRGLGYAPHTALSITADVLEGLRAAHDEGLVHGGPTADDVVLDDDGRVTLGGFRLPGAEELTPRTDVHAVGRLLHALLTGDLQAEEGVSLRPSATVPGLPPDLDMLVANATEPNPRYRPRDAGQYLTLVEQVLRSLPRPPDEAGTATQPIPVVDADAFAADPSPSRERGAPPRWRRLPVLAAAGVGLLVLAAAGWALVPGEDPALPDLAGYSPERAEAALAALELDLTFTYEDAYSEDVAPGEVASTDPAAGTELEGGEAVLMSLSVGPRHAEVPDVVGGTENDARNLLRGAGFTEVEVVQEHSAEETPGTVLSSDPEVGQDGDREEAVTLYVSEGVVVPAMAGTGRAEAVDLLSGIGLTVSVVEAPSDTVAAGLVSGQNPEPGTILPEDGAVTLTVSTGPEEVADDDGAEEGGQAAPDASCAVAAWDASTVYDRGDRVLYEGRVYEARWWIQAFPPDVAGEWGAWADQGPC
ncbi:PASTA domain-containing protein [Nocardiopsis sp. NPDC006938]|uniref:PASTA domain-containing protein n=1 Tax=Nocardiopsis sp. NPDC006938 TaxID=3364337 RepID=UPI0036B66373